MHYAVHVNIYQDDKFVICVWTAYKADGKWQEITFKEYYQMVQTAAKAFIKVCYSYLFVVV